ncbi:MAG: methyltransferase domain-containing protein [Chlamydiota bacterium]|nr:methyltransferase domain-containing protein [Chlamydiota bacterium]
MICLTPKQSCETEWMDGEQYTIQDLKMSLQGLRWINRYLGGASIMVHELRKLILQMNLQRLTILDVATGSADIPIRIVQWARQIGIELSIKAIDKNPDIVKIARKATQMYPEIEVYEKDCLMEGSPPESFDFCISSLFIHHLDPSQLIFFLKKLVFLSKKAVVLNDLTRSWVSYYSFILLSRLIKMHPMNRHDGAISILRSYTIKELHSILTTNKIHIFKINPCFPYRLCLVIYKGT